MNARICAGEIYSRCGSSLRRGVVHWFNPLAWLAVRAARIDTELACDETLLRHAGTTDAIAYGETLLKLTQLVSWRQPAIPIAAVTEGKGGIRLRLEGIASFTGHSTWQIAAALGILVGTSLVFAADETAKSVESANAPKTAAETEASAAGTVPEWAKDWSILHVIPPRDETDGAILVRAGGAGEKTLEKGKVSDSEPWLEKLELIATGDKRQWKATLRKGNEQAELLSVGSWSQQVEIHATFLETNETVIRRLRLKSKKGEGAGLRVLDDALRGRETNNVLTPAEGAELAATLANASGTHDLSGPTVLAGPRVTTRSGNRAVIEIIREFRYPTEWERDEQKQIWVPKAFETRNTGVTLEAEPLVTPQGAISITLTPQIVEFLGFKNLDTGKGLPRPEAKIGAPDPKQDARLARLFGPVLPMGNAQNPIWRCLPVFSARKLIVTPNLQSGEMVVCANLPETEDVAPFKSPAASTRVVVLVTARLIAPPPPAPTLKLGAPPSTPAPNYIPDPAIDEFLFGTAAEKRKAAKSSPPVVPANLQEKLPGFRAPGDAAGFVRSPYAPTAPAVDVRGFPPSTEVQCPTTGRVFVVPAR